jgi:hypothetical protein
MMGYGKEVTKTLLPTGVNSFVSSYQEYSTQLSLMEWLSQDLFIVKAVSGAPHLKVVKT